MTSPVVCPGILVADVIGCPIDSIPSPGTLALVPSISTHIGDLFFCPHEPETLAALLLNAGVKTVALKMSEHGCFVSNGRESGFVAPFEVEARDATGAGDAFAAGFLAGVF